MCAATKLIPVQMHYAADVGEALAPFAFEHKRLWHLQADSNSNNNNSEIIPMKELERRIRSKANIVAG